MIDRSSATIPSASMALALLVAMSTAGAAEEFSPFTLTGYDGHVSTSFVDDEFVSAQPGFGGAASSGSRQTQSDLRVEAFVMTHGHVYHPKFIKLDVGGGPVFQVGRAGVDASTTRSSRTLYNFSANATVLSDKPYNGTVYYEHLNPTLLLSPGEALLQEADKQGLSLALLAPVSPVAIKLHASRAHTTGNSALRVVDDRVDELTLHAERGLGTLGRTLWSYRLARQASSSGSPQLPIQGAQLRSESLNADTHLQFGSERQHDLFNTIVFNSQAYTLSTGRSPHLDDARVLLYYRGTHSSQAQSFINYNFSHSDQDSNTTRTQSANLGAVWAPASNFSASGGLRGEDVRAPQFSVRSWGVDAALRHERALAPGLLQSSYVVRGDHRSQTASQTQFAIVGEHLSLSGTNPVSLARPNVSGGTVVVTNAARTQTFIEGVDYVLSAVGASTRVQRLLAGAILDGQEVLVDYLVEVGGTYAAVQIDQSLDLSLGLARGSSLYFRYVETVPRVTSGTPTTPLNTVRSTLYGARVDAPPATAMHLVVGGYLEREDRRETLAPYVRTAAEIYLQGGLPVGGPLEVRSAARRVRLSGDNPLQDVDLTGYDLSLGWRHESGLSLSANAFVEHDTGGTQARNRRTGVLRAQWRYRRLSVTGDLSLTRESQGDYLRERKAGHLVMRRDF